MYDCNPNPIENKPLVVLYGSEFWANKGTDEK